MGFSLGIPDKELMGCWSGETGFDLSTVLEAARSRSQPDKQLLIPAQR
jgi:hypothetical protein